MGKPKKRRKADLKTIDLTLTPLQARFVEEYLVDLDATKSAIRAGYSPKSAHVTASRMLRLAKVQDAIARAQESLAKRTEITPDKVLKELAKLGFSNMADYIKIGSNGDPYIDLSALTRDQASAISEVVVDDFMDGRGEDAREVRRVKFKLHGKIEALTLIGKHLGMFVDKSEVKHEFSIQTLFQTLEQVKAERAKEKADAQQG